MDMEPGDRIRVAHDGGVFEGVFRELTQRVEEHKPPRWTFEMDNATIEIEGAFSESILEKHLVMPDGNHDDVYMLKGEHRKALAWKSGAGDWDMLTPQGKTAAEIADPVAFMREHDWPIHSIVKLAEEQPPTTLRHYTWGDGNPGETKTALCGQVGPVKPPDPSMPACERCAASRAAADAMSATLSVKSILGPLHRPMFGPKL